MQIVPLSAFSDNYIWAIVRGKRCALVDPGEAAAALRFLANHALELDAILLTHHHSDHIGGVPELLRHNPVALFGPQDARIPWVTHPLEDGDSFTLAGATKDFLFRTLAVPGHTQSHLAFLCEEALFCGDTLFSAGCGRIFEGSPEQMFASLQRLAELPDSTQVFCAHEYTEANLRFAQAVEPGNPEIAARIRACAALRRAGHPSLPSTLREEKHVNPFLRCNEANVLAAAQAYAPATALCPEACFATLRAWKNVF